MDTKEHAQAAAALINWFNDQDIRPADARAVMALVIAKAITTEHRRTPYVPGQEHPISAAIHKFSFDLVNDVNKRLYNER